jgi:hypothetical protein
MPPTGGDLEIVEVGADENDAGVRRCGNDPDVHRNAVVKAYSRGFHRPLDSSFKTQMPAPDSSLLLFEQLGT